MRKHLSFRVISLREPSLWPDKVLSQGDAGPCVVDWQAFWLCVRLVGWLRAGRRARRSHSTQYEKALPFALQGLKTGEILFGPEGMQLVGSKGLVCRLYDGLNQADKAEACDRQLVVLMEKTYGENSPVLASTLTSQAKALRALGRNAEAEDVEKRLQGLQKSTVGLN